MNLRYHFHFTKSIKYDLAICNTLIHHAYRTFLSESSYLAIIVSIAFWTFSSNSSGVLIRPTSTLFERISLPVFRSKKINIVFWKLCIKRRIHSCVNSPTKSVALKTVYSSFQNLTIKMKSNGKIAGIQTPFFEH